MTYTPFQFLRGTTAQNNDYTGQPGEITVDIELNQIRLHDGVTAGGHIIATQENASLDWNDITNRPNGLVSSSRQYSTGSYTGSFNGILTASGHLIPTENEQFDLGSLNNKWRDLYLSGSTIYLGDIALKVVNKQLVVVDLLSQAPTAFFGAFTGSVFGTSSHAVTASYVAGAVSSWNEITGKPTVVSSSNQISYTEIQDKPTTIPTASHVTFTNVANKPTLISSSAQVLLNTIAGTTFSNTAFYFPQNVRVEGTLTAQEYHTELISASIIYQSGSTQFGNTVDDVHVFTGSIRVNGGITSSLFGTSSRAIIADFADTTNKIEVITGGSTTGQGIYNGQFTGSLYGTASYALNADGGKGFPFSGSAIITGSLLVSGSGITGSLDGTASRATTAEQVDVIAGGSTTGQGIYNGQFTGSLFGTSSYALNAERNDKGFPYSGSAIITGSLLISSSGITLIGTGLTGSVFGTSSNAVSASLATIAEKIDIVTGGSTTGEGIYRGEFTGSLFGTSSYALNAGQSDGFPYSGNAIITGSLLVSGSGITGSLQGTASNAISSSYSVTSSYAGYSPSASRSTSTEKIDVVTGGLTTGEGIYTGSLYGTASYALNANSGAGFPFSGSAEITGSLLISGSGLRTTGSITVFGNVSATNGFLGTSSYALFVLQDTFTGSFKGDGSQLYFSTLNTSQSSNSELIIGNIYNNYQYRQKTVFRNAEVVISGSTTIADGGVLVMTPQESPTPIAGGIFYSASGQFFVGTE